MTKKGAIVVVAAGNANQSVAEVQPASCKGVIAVAAIDKQGQRASFSNYGEGITIAAPGVDILSTSDSGTSSPLNDNSYVNLSGTSMAAPHVAGIVALMLAVNSSMTSEQVLKTLQDTARPFPVKSNPSQNCTKSQCGAGLIDAGAAVESAKNQKLNN